MRCWLYMLIAAVFLCLSAAVFALSNHAPSTFRAADNPAELGLLLQQETGGVSVLAVQDKSIADRAGVFPGDMMLQANGTAFATINEFDEMLQHAAEPVINLHLMRMDEVVTVQMAFKP